ncbi:phage tail tape measure protein [Segatella copri]|jgi:TP901 family phage tail tape measure protein|uniref:Phage tail tape measure protein n=1 Tax=Segatella copri TaxID=165179 RepID=A0AA92V0F5_9BACT|nr:phage tail tape measure protein [Segatella copri]RHA84783.1 phage tail tape measure protein [Segatella copri]
MANSTQTFIGRVLLDDKQAKQTIALLEKQLEQVKQKKTDAFKKGDDTKAFDKEINRINASLKTLRTNQEQVNRTFNNLSSASYKELSVVMKTVQKQLRSGAVERNSEEWKKLQQKLKEVKREMNAINSESKETTSLWSRFVNVLNTNWGAVSQIIAAYAGLSMTIRKCAQAYADMEESMANVRKYTGQTDEEVHRMNEDFKRMDTRTAREQLNELAGSAGRLGITSKDMIEEFVDGADKINVALGDDLGEGAVDKIGKLAQMFGEDKTKGLRGAMLATGSAVNELAQNSSANAGYIVDFTADLSGVGIQAGMTQAQLMGLASALDQNMQEEATSATVFSQLITKMYQEPAKFAKIAGVEVTKFSNLMKTNANEGLMTFLSAMKSRGGFAEMAPMFEEMQLNGTRAVGVLSAVASHLDQVRTAQDLATQSYASGTSVINEFNVQNNTVQAQLDKAKKRFEDLTVELGEQLIPVTRYAISTLSIGIHVLSTLITFTFTHVKQLTIIGSAIAVCTALWYKETIAIKLKAAATTYAAAIDKAYIATTTLLRAAMVALQATWAYLTKGVQGYIVVMRAARLASLTNPWAALATVLTVVGVAVYGAVKAFTSYNEAMRNSTQEAKNNRAVAEAQASLAKKVSDATLDERNKVDMLNKVIHSNVYTVDERRQAIAAMQKLVPEYHASISKEGKLYNDNQIAIQNYIKELENAAMAEAIYERKVEINKKKLELKLKESKIRHSLKAVDAERKSHPERYESEAVADAFTGQLIEQNDALKSNEKQKEIHTRRLKENLSLQQQLNAEESYYNTELRKNANLQKLYKKKEKKSLQGESTGTNRTTGSTGHYTTEKERKAAEKEQKKREAATRKAEIKRKADLKKELDDAKKSTEAQQLEATTLYSTGQIRLAEYNDRMAKIKEQGLQQRMDILRKYGEAESEEYKRLNAQKEKISADYERKQTQDLQDLEYDRQVAEQAITAEYYNKDSDLYHNESAINEALFQLDQTFLKEKQALYLKSSDEYWQIAREIERSEQQHQYDRQKQYDDTLMQLKQEYLTLGNEQQMQLELAGLDEVHKAGLVSEEEYQRMKMGIANKYASYKPDAKDQAKDDATTALDTAKKMTRQTDDRSGSLGSDNLATIAGGAIAAIQQQKMVNDNLQKLREEDMISEQAYQDAKKQMNQETYKNIAAIAGAAFSSISSMMGAASAYSQACSDLEVAKIQANYDKQISAAGNNSAKKKRLEAKRDKEISAAKTKANKKAMKIEIAQAIASTAMAAINAYSSAAAIKGVGWIMAPIAAGLATAAGMMQIATIKKQHQAEAAGYYEGGFTGPGHYKKEAGVVHAGEFVANHNAVNNPQLLPALQLIDAAQRNNTVASLTAQDVSRAMGTGSAAVVAPVVNVNADNEQVGASLDNVSSTIERLNEQLNLGIKSYVVITGPDGFDRKWSQYQKMKSNK